MDDQVSFNHRALLHCALRWEWLARDDASIQVYPE
jgi:hypothetical protein